MYITAQVFITLSVICLIPACFAKSKTTLFLLQAISQLFFCLQYGFLSAYAGLINSLAELIRVVLFYFYEKHNSNFKLKVSTCVVAFCFSTILTILTWQGWFSIFPILGLLALYSTLFSKKLYIVKSGMFVLFSCSIIYLFIIGSTYGAILELFILAISLFGTIKDIKNKK